MTDQPSKHEPDSGQGVGRRDFLKSAVVGGAAAATTAIAPQPAAAQQPAAPAPTAAYEFLNLEEQAFVEALVDHMIPADELTPKGTDLGINIFIDRALGGAWGKGDRLYMQGPWKVGVPSQGYQLPLTPAQLYRAGIEATNAHCTKTYRKAFDKLDEAQREEVLVGLSGGKRAARNASRSARPTTRSPPARTASARACTTSSSARPPRWTISATRRPCAGAASPGRRRRSTPSSPTRRRWCRRTACPTPD
jgi:Gluconate 2-dehydrogenase subunit 3/TAT (twin-arginine translocation) pathway signal sequence